MRSRTIIFTAFVALLVFSSMPAHAWQARTPGRSQILNLSDQKVESLGHRLDRLSVSFDKDNHGWAIYNLAREEKGLPRFEPKIGEYFAIAPRTGEDFIAVHYEPFSFASRAMKSQEDDLWVLVDYNYDFVAMVIKNDEIIEEYDPEVMEQEREARAQKWHEERMKHENEMGKSRD